MAGPFYNAIKSVSSGAAGTGAFTPAAASAGFLAWSTVPAGWIGLVRYEDGAAWELRYGYWNGTTISRPSNIVASSSGSALTLTSSATAALVIDAADVQPHLGSSAFRANIPNNGLATMTAIGFTAPTLLGSAAGWTPTTGSLLANMNRVNLTSAGTANAQCGIHNGTIISAITSTTAGQGGWEYTDRFGISSFPTDMRAFRGMTGITFVGKTVDPSAMVGWYAALSKDAADTNFQFLTNSNAGTGTKIDTGIAPVATGVYDLTIWQNPGSETTFMLLIRLDTGAIFYTSTATDVPTNNALLWSQSLLSNAAAGTAVVLGQGTTTLRSGT